MLLNVVFSYNRAMQLDCFLESFINNIRFPTNYELAVVYHTTGEHKHGYEKLIKKYSNEKLKFMNVLHLIILFFTFLSIYSAL